MLEFPIDFFDDEVRDGFYVPSMMKRCWAAQMEVIKTVDEICKKNNIDYFIISGTLMGAIRHGGYIPWDDDVDICMLRRDYQKFIKVAPNEVPEGYFIRNMHTDPTYRDCFTRFCNGSHIDFTEEFWKMGHGFVCTAGIDLFPLDYIPDDIKYRDAIREEARLFYSIARLYDDQGGLSDDVKGMIAETEKRYGAKFDMDGEIPQQALIYMENTFRKVRSFDGKKVHIPLFWMDNVDLGMPARAFEHTIDVSFENTTFKAPYLYDEVLSTMYGNYMKSVRVCDIHDYPWYSPILHELQTIEFEKYYDYDASVIPENNRREKWFNKTVSELNEAVEVFTKASAVAEKAFVSGDADSGNKLLAKCQELAGKAERLEKALKGNGRQRVVFFCWKANLWAKLDPFYRAEVAAGNEVFVIPVRFVRMTEERKISEPFMEMEGYPEDIVLTDYETFDYDEYRIDRIYTQNNYDDMNGAVRLADFFYTSNLQKYTDELIYVPWYELDEYGEDDERAAYVMKYSVFMPGTVVCDRMLVSAQWFKDRCVSELTKWAGEDTKEMWENKIEVASWDDSDSEENTEELSDMLSSNKCKNLFYYIGTGQILANTKTMIEKMENNIEVFEASGDKIKVRLYIEAGMRDNIMKYAPKLLKDFDAVCGKYAEYDWCELILADKPVDVNDYHMMKEIVDKSDAFYGDAGVILHFFERAKKPVMLQNVEV